jgi:hypothetical protein
MILGTADLFNVDQRTAALISHRMRRASKERQEAAVKLAAMAEMCIYHRFKRSLGDQGHQHLYLTLLVTERPSKRMNNDLKLSLH